MARMVKKTKFYVLVSLAVTAFITIAYTMSLSQGQVLSDNDNISVFSRFLPKPTDYATEFSVLTNIIKERKGTLSLYIKNLQDSRVYAYQDTLSMYSASLYKVPVTVAALKQIQNDKISLDKELVYLTSDYSVGTGIINQTPYGTKYTLDYTLKALLKESDNSAQNMIIRTLSSTDLINAFNLSEASTSSEYWVTNITSAQNYGLYLENVYKGDYLSDTSKEYLYETLKNTSFDDRISAYLNDDVEFSHKIGNWGAPLSWHDCGLAKYGENKVVVCLMSNNMEFNDFLTVSKYTAEFVNNIIKK